MIRVIAVAALLAVFPLTRSAAQCSDADKAALEAFDKSWGAAGQRGDRAFLEGAYAASYVGHNVAGQADKATTIANTMRTFERNKANPQSAAVPDHYMISCSPTTATITHRSTFTSATGAPGYSRAVHFLQKNGATWQVVSSTSHALTDEQQLAYLEQDWNDADENRDLAWLGRLYAPEFTSISSRDGALASRAEDLESTKNSKRVTESTDLSELNIRVNGDFAVVTGMNRVRGREADGKPFDRKVRFTDTFAKRDGRWQALATQGTTVQ